MIIQYTVYDYVVGQNFVCETEWPKLGQFKSKYGLFMPTIG
jgi:hypothetical protein